MKYSIKKISWVETIFAPMQDVNSVTIEIFVKAGSIYETEKTNGISHFLEHMFFKWWKKYKTPKEVASAVDSFGGEFNAYTSGWNAGYYVKCAPEFVEKAIDVLGDMLVDSQFPLDEMEREKWVVIQEIKMKEDAPTSLIYDKWKTAFLGNNSYGRATLGPVENVKNFTQEMLFNHKNTLYTKNNLIIVVAGKIEDQIMIENYLSDSFWNLPETNGVIKPKFEFIKPKDSKNKYIKKTEQNHLIISGLGVDWLNEDRYKTNVLATILGGNMSSRLFQNIREKEWLCYYVWGSHYTMPDLWLFLIRAGLEKWRFEYGVKRIFEEIKNIAEWNFSEEEFLNAVGYRKWQLQMWIESSEDMASFLWSQYLLYGKIDSLEDMLKSYEGLSLNDVKSVANLLDEEKLYMYWIE